MRDAGLEEAVAAFGGVGNLSRALGIAQPSVSAWRRVPAERVLDVERLTGVPRTRLRADLYPPPVDGALGSSDVDELDLARAAEYQLLATLLLRAPDGKLLQRLRLLRGDPSPLGLAHAGLGEAALRAEARDVEREFFNLFIGLGRGELLPYASYYLTGFLHERPLATLRTDLAELGIEPQPGRAEPEDHVGTLLEVMSGLLARRFEAAPEASERFFKAHLAPWAPRFLSDLEVAQEARFYRAVGAYGHVLMGLEMEAMELPLAAA